MSDSFENCQVVKAVIDGMKEAHEQYAGHPIFVMLFSDDANASDIHLIIPDRKTMEKIPPGVRGLLRNMIMAFEMFTEERDNATKKQR